MWKLDNEKDGLRTYTNSATGSKCETKKVYTDNDGNNWWFFQDLMTLPQTRQLASHKITSLYALGLSKDDLFGFINSVKTLAKSADGEKYEKIYAATLDFETKANNATDAVTQLSSLVCVYFLLNDEVIDSWDNNLVAKKMQLLSLNPEMHNFFLNRQLDAIERYQMHSKLLFQTVSPQLKEMSEVSV